MECRLLRSVVFFSFAYSLRMWQVQEQARALRALRQDSIESVMALAGMQVAKDIAKSLIFMPIIQFFKA